MDETELRDRLRALEARVAQLEGQIAHRTTEPAPAPLPVAPRPDPAAETEPGRAASGSSPAGAAWSGEPRPLPANRQPSARERTEERQGPDYERFLGLAVLGRVGIAAVLLAAAYFGQLGWKHLGPGARATIVYTGGVVLVGLGAWLRPRVAAKYVALLWGGGVALTYLGGVLAYLRFHVVSSPVAVASLLGSAALGQFLARALGLQAMATVALAGAYAAPVLVGAPSPVPTAFFTLLLTLHAWAAWTEHRWQWHAARGVAVAATVGLSSSWYAANGTVSAWSFVLHGNALWLGLVAPELIAAVQRRRVAAARAALAGLGLAVVLFAVLCVTPKRALPGANATMAMLALLGGAWLRPRAMDLGTWVARAGSVGLAIGFVVWSDDWGPWTDPAALAGWRLGGLLVIGGGLLATRRWTGVGDLGAALAAMLTYTVTGAAGIATATGGYRRFAVAAVATWLWLLAAGQGALARLVGLFGGAFASFFWLQGGGCFGGAGATWLAVALAAASGTSTLGAYVAARDRDRLLAWASAGLQAVVLCAWAALAWGARTSHSAEPQAPLWNARTGALAAIVVTTLLARRRLPAHETPLRAVLAACAIAGVYFAGLLELLDAVADLAFGPRAVASSLYTLAFASSLLVAGFWRRIPTLRWTALLAFVAVVVKIAAHDLREVDTPVRVLATGVLGGVLLLAAWGYAKRGRSGA